MSVCALNGIWNTVSIMERLGTLECQLHEEGGGFFFFAVLLTTFENYKLT